jgi:hypothetical protein
METTLNSFKVGSRALRLISVTSETKSLKEVWWRVAIVHFDMCKDLGCLN